MIANIMARVNCACKYRILVNIDIPLARTRALKSSNFLSFASFPHFAPPPLPLSDGYPCLHYSIDPFCYTFFIHEQFFAEMCLYLQNCREPTDKLSLWILWKRFFKK